MRPLALLVFAEALVLVLLAVAWFGGTGNAAAPAAQPSPEQSRARPASPAAAGTLAANAATAANTTPAVQRDAAPAAMAKVAANDPIGIVLSGSVRTADGTPVDGANVGVQRDGSYRAANSAAPGTWAIAGLQPGEWSLTCRADGFAPHEATITLDDRAFQQIDVELQPSFVVRVRMQDASGRAIAEALQQKTMWGMPYVVATEQPLVRDLPPTIHTRVARFGIGEWKGFHERGVTDVDPKLKEQGYAGELLLNRAPPAHASLLLRTTLLQSQPIAPGQQELVFTIDVDDVLGKHGTVKLRLLDAAGAPIAGARLNVRTAQGGGTHAKTGEDGVAVIERVAPGIGMLQLQAAGEREQLYRYVRVPSGGTVDLGDITLGPAEKVTGTVLGNDGKPANGASVQWTELDCRTFAQPLVDNRSSQADAEGKFQLWGAGRHRYVVFARMRDGTFGTATVDARNGAPPDVTIRLGTPTKVALHVKLAPTDGCTVTAVASDGSPVAVATLASEYRPRTMSLLPGDYTIQINDLFTDRLMRTFPLQVGTEPLTIDVP